MPEEQKLSLEPSVGALTLHMPWFMPSDPQLRSTLVELQFESYRLTSDISRFKWVVGRIPPDVTLQVRYFTLSSSGYDAL